MQGPFVQEMDEGVIRAWLLHDHERERERLILRRGTGGGRVPAEELLRTILATVPVPGTLAVEDEQGAPARRGR